MLQTILFLFAESCLLTLLLGWVILKVFPKIGLLDRPERYGLKRAPIPYPGGIVFYFIFIGNLILLTPADSKYLGLILGLTILVVVSFLDDRRNLSPYVRLLFQLLSAGIIAFSGIGITTITNPLGGAPFILDGLQYSLSLGGATYTFAPLSILFTIVWIIIFINTLNWLDGIPGLVSGVSGIGFLVVFALSLMLGMRTNVGLDEITQANLIAQLAIVGVGMCLAFLYFDFYPPKMIMGDSGSMILGCLIAVLAIYSGSKVATTFLVLGFPVLDAIFVVLRRLRDKKSPFKGDLNHFHHRLLRIGFTERKTLLVMYLICAVFGTSALFMGSKEKFIIILLLIILSALIESLVIRQEKKLARK